MEILYGIRTDDPFPVAKALQSSLGRQFEGRESTYKGDYWLSDEGGAKITVLEWMSPEGDVHEPDFPDYKVLIRVEGSTPVQGIAGLETPVGVIEQLRELR
ncbi:hypothetical protein [Glycomyces tenuis]|uniref:hypothetical protein n=1 Tax=Glycomyces tenuis TaxID=58116 RepID=UPI0012DC3AF6|nr:hypothetical protein [Glycomyces tenuis]